MCFITDSDYNARQINNIIYYASQYDHLAVHKRMSCQTVFFKMYLMVYFIGNGLRNYTALE